MSEAEIAAWSALGGATIGGLAGLAGNLLAWKRHEKTELDSVRRLAYTEFLTKSGQLLNHVDYATEKYKDLDSVPDDRRKRIEDLIDEVGGSRTAVRLLATDAVAQASREVFEYVYGTAGAFFDDDWADRDKEQYANLAEAFLDSIVAERRRR